jgi:RNA polymerase sigma-70 factor (ECF subfamily)
VDVDEFDAWVAASAPRLHRTAYLLVGDWGLAQDLVQQACTAVWPRFGRLDSPEAYARTVMVRAATSGWRRKWRGEIPTEVLPEQLADPWTDIDRRESLRRALRGLPAKQRAVVILRFYDDLSEADTAAALGWPLGTVKSTCARALATLRLQGLEDSLT